MKTAFAAPGQTRELRPLPRNLNPLQRQHGASNQVDLGSEDTGAPSLSELTLTIVKGNQCETIVHQV